MTKQEKLSKIAREIGRCKICKRHKVGLPVPGEGSAKAKVMFIGEAPGKEESKTGRPFVGRAGKILRKLVADSGLKDNDIFITSPVHYLPKHGTPTKKEVDHSREHTLKQLEIIKPRLVVLMGRIACLAMLNRPCEISQERGKIMRHEGHKYLITYHPAAPFYARKVLPLMERDFAKIKKQL